MVHNRTLPFPKSNTLGVIWYCYVVANALEAVWDVLPENLKKVYSLPDGSIKKAGDMVTRPDLADTLESISTDGVSAFYENGKIAQSIIASVRNSDGILTQEDLDAYQVKMEEPLQTQFNGRYSDDNLCINTPDILQGTPFSPLPPQGVELPSCTCCPC